MALGEELVQVGSFEATVRSWAVADEAVGLLTNEREVHVIGRQRHDTIEVDRTAHDIAIGERIYAVTDDELVAYSRAGTRLWSAAIFGEAVAAPETATFVVVLTDDDELVGFDGANGSEQFRVDRPHADVAGTPELICTEDRLVLSAWSFCAVLESDGEPYHEVMLDGAIDALGVVDDTVVCVLKDGRVVGVDIGEQEPSWTREWAVTDVDPYARGRLLLRTDDGIHEITADGDSRRVGDDSGGLPVAAVSGEPVCLVHDDTVAVYHRPSDDDDTAVYQRPTGGDPSEASTEPARSEVEVSAMIDRLERDVASVRIEAHNPGTKPVGGLAVEPTGTSLPDVPPGGSLDETVTVSADERIVAVTDGDRTLADCELPDSPLSCRIDGGALIDVCIENRGSGTVSARLEIGGSAIPDGIERDLNLAPGSVAVFVITPIESGPSDVRVEWGDGQVIAAERIDVPADAVPQRSPSREQTSDTDAAVDTDTRAGDTEEETVSSGGSTDENGGQSGAPEAGSDGVDEPSMEDIAAGSTEDPEGADASAVSIAVDRAFSTSQPTVGQLFAERLTIENDGSVPSSVHVEEVDTTVPVGSIEPGDETNITRGHVVTDRESQSIHIPPVAVAYDGGSREFEERELAVVDEDLFVVATIVSRPNGEVALQLVLDNRSKTSHRIDGLRLYSADFSIPEDVPPPSVDPGATTTWETPIEGPTDGREEPVQMEFVYAPPGGDGTRYRTLAAVKSVEDVGLPQVELEVLSASTIGDEDGILVLAVSNDGTRPLRDFRIEATGELPRSIIYDGDALPELARGERHVHEIDVVVPDGEFRVPVELSARIGDRTVTEEAVVHDDGNTDPRTDPVAGLTIDRSRCESAEMPSLVSTEFRIDD